MSGVSDIYPGMGEPIATPEAKAKEGKLGDKTVKKLESAVDRFAKINQALKFFQEMPFAANPDMCAHLAESVRLVVKDLQEQLPSQSSKNVRLRKHLSAMTSEMQSILQKEKAKSGSQVSDKFHHLETFLGELIDLNETEIHASLQAATERGITDIRHAAGKATKQIQVRTDLQVAAAKAQRDVSEVTRQAPRRRVQIPESVAELGTTKYFLGKQETLVVARDLSKTLKAVLQQTGGKNLSDKERSTLNSITPEKLAGMEPEKLRQTLITLVAILQKAMYQQRFTRDVESAFERVQKAVKSMPPRVQKEVGTPKTREQQAKQKLEAAAAAAKERLEELPSELTEVSRREGREHAAELMRGVKETGKFPTTIRERGEALEGMLKAGKVKKMAASERSAAIADMRRDIPKLIQSSKDWINDLRERETLLHLQRENWSGIKDDELLNKAEIFINLLDKHLPYYVEEDFGLLDTFKTIKENISRLK